MNKPGTDLIKSYVLGVIAGTELERALEEHLLVCHSCQDSFESPDTVIARATAGAVSKMPVL
jgi:hypothetical protein